MVTARVGIDVGGTTIKAAVVDVTTGKLLSSRLAVQTPSPPTLPRVEETINHLVADLVSPAAPALPVGIGLPISVLDDGRLSGVGLHPTWDSEDAWASVGRVPNVRSIINDADAAATAELHLGELNGVPGTSLLLTLGTGIGIALARNRAIFPNVEVGFLPYKDGKTAESLLGAVARERRGVTWTRWGREFSEYLGTLRDMFQPTKIVIGGGVSEISGQYLQHLSPPCQLVIAHFRSTAGIVGAAIGELTLTRDPE